MPWGAICNVGRVTVTELEWHAEVVAVADVEGSGFICSHLGVGASSACPPCYYPTTTENSENEHNQKGEGFRCHDFRQVL